VSFRYSLKPVLKRGCLVAAANWPVTLVQSTADSLFKLLIAVPLVGGVFLVALVLGADPGALFSLTWGDFVTTTIASLLSHPGVLVMFLLSLATVAIGGSLFVFLIKAGTIGVLVAGNAAAGPIEEPPLHFETVAKAARFSIELFVERAQALFHSYAKLGFALMVVYVASSLVYLTLAWTSRFAGDSWLFTCDAHGRVRRLDHADQRLLSARPDRDRRRRVRCAHRCQARGSPLFAASATGWAGCSWSVWGWSSWRPALRSWPPRRSA
jgi:hypothetical protein